jgi:hypothetical protein
MLIQDKRTLFSIWFADLFVMVGSLFVLQDRYNFINSRLPDIDPSAVSLSDLANPGAALSLKGQEAVSPVPATEELVSEPLARPRQTRNIMFSFRHSKPARVEVIGSFTNWDPRPLVKGKNHTWTASFPLAPGEYTYNFIVDGRVIRDPNNPRTAPEGRSLLVVQPADPLPPPEE